MKGAELTSNTEGDADRSSVATIIYLHLNRRTPAKQGCAPLTQLETKKGPACGSGSAVTGSLVYVWMVFLHAQE